MYNTVIPQHHTDWGLESSSPWEETETRGPFKQWGGQSRSGEKSGKDEGRRGEEGR